MGVALLLQQLPHGNLSLVFLTTVLVVAARWGLAPSIYASVLSFLVFNFLFTPPFYTFRVSEEGDIATLVFFLAVAALTGNLAARMRTEMSKNQVALGRISNLYQFSRRMASAASAEEVLQAFVDHLSGTFECAVVVLLPDESGKPTAQATSRGRWQPDTHDAQEAARAWARGTGSGQTPSWLFLPLATARRQVGLVGLALAHLGDDPLEQVRTLCDQAALAVERTALVTDLEEARVVSETERLRSALLSSVSHDLRTPLSSIIGSATSLIEYGQSLTAENQRELLQTVFDEAERLNRYIQNLLDMTRLGQGGLKLCRDWVDLNDVVSGARERLHSELAGIELHIHVAPEVALMYVHGAFIEQALVNMLDNAARFSQPGGRIDIEAWVQGERVLIDVVDQGPGIPETDRDKVFDMFYSVQQRDRRLQGAGLGLAICRGLIGAHGGEVSALPGPGGIGTRMRIILPRGAVDEDDQGERPRRAQG
ncbi:MAG: DUF4118 domain-containing protein [Burkholderiales bacterium]|nr:DUF4118 domain-containing protein [Burkholderiales bacterium]